MGEQILADIKAIEPGEEILISTHGRLYFVRAATIDDFKEKDRV